jgi:4-amino-4-deoxy-L-arabinose transferase-like glycosyltransferase
MSPQTPGETTATTAQRIGWAALIVITLSVCYFSHLGVIGFVGPDEPRYAWIARDMAESGDWVTPRLYGKPWFEKPPLLYWGGAIFFRLMPGEPEVAARLPSAISALLATLALAWLTWRTYGEECARWLLLLLPTSVGMIGFSHAAATDMPFAGMLTIAMVCVAVGLGLARSDQDKPILPQTPWLALVLFGFFLGLATLAKGPAAIILSGGAVFFWAIFTKRWRDALRLLHPAAIVSFCVTALPWYILCARRNPDFFRIFIVEHNFKRYLTPEFQHVQPFWFYAPILLVAFLPWTAVVMASLILGGQRFRRKKQASPLTSLLLCWSLFCLLFFTISKSKLPGYILPSISAISLLFARVCELGLREKSRLLGYLVAACMIFFGIASGTAALVQGLVARHSPLNGRAAGATSVVALAFALANFFLWIALSKSGLSRTRLRIFEAVGMALPVIVLVLSTKVLLSSFVPVDPSGKTIADELELYGYSANDLAIQGMHRGTHFSLNFYLKQEIPDWDVANSTSGFLLLNGRNCEAVVGKAGSCNDTPDYLPAAQRYVYKVTTKKSLTGLGGGREPK